jgi:putative transposase
MFRGYKFRLYPTAEQEATVRQFAGVCRLVYNLALECRTTFWREHIRNTGKPITMFSQCRELTQLRAEYDWIAAVPRVALEAALKDLDTAFKNFFEGRAEYPRPRRKGERDAFLVRGPELRTQRINTRWSRVWIPKLGWVKYRDSRAIPGRICYLTVSLRAGKWYVSASTEIDASTVSRPTAPVGSRVGIDRGVANTLTLSTGEQLSVPSSLNALERRQRRMKRALARKCRGSARHGKHRKRIAAVAARCARIRGDWHHKVTTDLARRYGEVVIEDLKTANMTAAGPRKRGLNRAILNQGWHIFESTLAYKLDERGGALIKIHPAYTSQTCSACGTIDRESRESQASFVCRHCGFAIHADHNAALNILRLGSTQSLRVEEANSGSDEARTGRGEPAENQALIGLRMLTKGERQTEVVP